MKRKGNSKWAVTPAFLIFSVVMFISAGISYSYNILIFYIELFLAIASVLVVFLSLLSARRYIASSLKSSVKKLTGSDRDFLEKFSFPVAVTGFEGDILWINSKFQKEISTDHTPHGEYISNYLDTKATDDVFSDSGLDVDCKNKRYTVYAVASGKNAVYYFIENTQLKNLRDEYYNTRPCVVCAVFDNREEFERDSEDDSVNSVLAPLEALLIKWATSYNGSYKKISGNKYLIVFEEAEFKKIVDNKFQVLDEIRKIKSPQGIPVTVSMGIGCSGENFRVCEQWSRKALEMALGRGGDQAVIKRDNEYQFFGGVSQGVERRDKVRSRVIALALSEKIKASDKVYIMGHKYSDLDCIGAAAGLYAVITKAMKKEAYVVVKEALSPALPLIKNLKAGYDADMFIDPNDTLKNVSDKSLLIITDTHSPDFLESEELYKKAKNVVVIDHHRMMVNHISNAAIFYQETFASSASEMVSELVQYLGDQAINKPIAEALMAGIMLDTKNFTIKTGSRTFDASAYLCRKSADTIAVKHLFANTLEEYKARCELVFNSEQFGSFAIASTSKSTKNIRITAAQAADELLNIQNVDASFVIFPISGAINISARSLGKVNVQLIMESLGGGGHLTMAAVQIKGITTEQARNLLMEKLEELQKQKKN